MSQDFRSTKSAEDQSLPLKHEPYKLQLNPEDPHLWSKFSSAHEHQDELKVLKESYQLRSSDFLSAVSDERKRGGVSVVVKIWPRPRWWHVSLIYQLFEVHQSSPLKSMLFLTSSRSSPLRGFLRSEDFSSEPSSSNNRSPLILADSYATLLSFTFITCNTTQCGQLWTAADFSACSHNKPTPLITDVTMRRTCNHEDLNHNCLPPCLKSSQV